MEHAPRNVLLLACCQALLLTVGVTLISVSSLAGYDLAPDRALATLPATTAVIGAALAAFPASLRMKRVGRRKGLLTGGVFGLAGGVVAALAIAAGSFWGLCLGTFLLGVYNAFGQYHRFAAADAAPPAWRAKAISLVLAGGLLGGILGPQISRRTIDLLQPRFLATYASLVAFCLLGMALVSFLRIPAARDDDGGQEARPLRAIAAQPMFVVAVLSAALGFAVMNLLMTATPLAMGFCGHPYDAAASVIAAHVVAMFAPSFFTGSLIQRLGVLKVILAGVALMLACVAVALSGEGVGHFSGALVLLGVGWNFMFVGGTTLLTEAYRPAEKAKAQGLNEIVVFGLMTVSSFSSGVLVNRVGWRVLNQAAVPLIVLAGLATVWLMVLRRAAARATA